MVGFLFCVPFKTPSPITSSNSSTGRLYLLYIFFLSPISFACSIFPFAQLSFSLSPFILLLHPQFSFPISFFLYLSFTLCFDITQTFASVCKRPFCPILRSVPVANPEEDYLPCKSLHITISERKC